MNKLFLALLLLPVVVHSSEKQQQFEEALKKSEQLLKDPEYLKFILGNNLDLHIYGVMTPGLAQGEVDRIHSNLVSEIGENKIGFLAATRRKNHFDAGKSLPKSPDAAIVNTCATMEQNVRKTGFTGEISGNNHFLGDSQAALWLTSRQFAGTKFYEDACPCNFYKKLTDTQLEQLIKGTQEAGK